MNTDASNFIQLATLLWRGGTHAYFWVKNGEDKTTIWFDKKKAPSIPNKHDVYFGVFSTLGKKEKWERAENKDISSLTAFYADFDSKDFGGDLSRAYAHIQGLDTPPTAIVCSGGGYHCYWIFEQIFDINEPSDEAFANEALSLWIDYVGGDKECKGIARVLRVPSTYNQKYNPPRLSTCDTNDCDFSRRYDYRRLIATAEAGLGRKLFEPVEKAPDPKPLPKVQKGDNRYRQWILAGLRNVTSELSSTGEGGRNSTLYDKSMTMAGYIHLGIISQSEIEEAMKAAAYACGLVADTGLKAVEASIKSGIKNGMAKPLDYPELEDKPIKPEIKREPVYTPNDFDGMIQFSDDVYDFIADEIDGKRLRKFEPIVLPYTPIHQFEGFAEYIHPGNLVFIMSSAGFGKTAFVDMLRENYSKMGIDTLWDGPEWKPIDMAIRGLHREGVLNFRQYTEYLLFATDKKAGVPLHECRGHDFTVYQKQQIKNHLATMKTEWPGKTFYTTPESMNFEQRIVLYDYTLKRAREAGFNPRAHFLDYINLVGKTGDWSELDYQVAKPYKEWVENNDMVGFVVVQAKREAFGVVKQGGTLDETHLQGISPQKCKLLIALTPGLSPEGEKLDFATVTVGKNNPGRTGSVKVKNALNRFTWSDEIVV